MYMLAPLHSNTSNYRWHWEARRIRLADDRLGSVSFVAALLGDGRYNTKGRKCNFDYSQFAVCEIMPATYLR